MNLEMPNLSGLETTLVTTELLGKAAIPDAAYENADGSPLSIDTDFFGATRNKDNPTAGPFEAINSGQQLLKLW